MAALQAAQSSSPAGAKPLTGGPPPGSGGGKVAALKANVNIPMTPSSAGSGAKTGGGGAAKEFRTPGAASADDNISGEGGGKVAALRANMTAPTPTASSAEGGADDKPRSARSGGRIAGLRNSIAGSIPMAMPGMGPPPGMKPGGSASKKPTKPEDYDLDRCLTLDRPRAPKDRKPPTPNSGGSSPSGRPDLKKRGESAPILRLTETEDGDEDDDGDSAAGASSKKSVPDID